MKFIKTITLSSIPSISQVSPRAAAKASAPPISPPLLHFPERARSPSISSPEPSKFSNNNVIMKTREVNEYQPLPSSLHSSSAPSAPSPDPPSAASPPASSPVIFHVFMMMILIGQEITYQKILPLLLLLLLQNLHLVRKSN